MNLKKAKLLIVDDDPMIRKLCWKTFQFTGLLIYQADSIESALDISSRINFDLFLLDVCLIHENDGYYLAQQIREQFPLIPIIFLSGKTSEQEIIAGLDSGADYYITKPFSPNLLKAQVINTLSRYQQLSQKTPLTNEVIEYGPFSFNQKTFSFYKNNQKIDLSSKESQLITFFLKNPNQVFSKEQILANVWNEPNGEEKIVKVYISHLRNKIEDNPKEPKFIKTIWGVGYGLSID